MSNSLCNRAYVRELLERYSLSPKKGFGQNFLVNPDIPERIALTALGNSAENQSGVIEIGPGIGAMTRELSGLFEKVVAVEIDRGLIPLLAETLSDCDNVTVLCDDFLKLDLGNVIRDNFGDMQVRICANLPYYVTTPVLIKILESANPSDKPYVKSVTVMIQTEVADRICAKPGSADYGALTVAVALRGYAKKMFTVAAGNFYPAPKVSSSVIRIDLADGGMRELFADAPNDSTECDRFFEKVREVCAASFAMRRKTLTNALAGLYPKEKVAASLRIMELREDIRGERLSAHDFCKLTSLLQYGE